MLNNLGKPMILSMVMMSSLWYLGCPAGVILALGIVPLVLGLLSIMVPFSYTLVGVTFVVAAMSSLLPSKYKDAWTFLSSVTASDVDAAQQAAADGALAVASGLSKAKDLAVEATAQSAGSSAANAKKVASGAQQASSGRAASRQTAASSLKQ
jgi:hypothetical protein